MFPPHQPSAPANLADLSLYISSDKNTSGHIVINGDSISFNIIAFTPQEFILPRATTYVGGAESATDDPTSIQKIVLNKGIKVGIRFTLTQSNAHDFPAMLQLMDDYNIDKFYIG